MREKEALKQKVCGRVGEPPPLPGGRAQSPEGKRMAEEVGSKLVAWQEKLLARRKYVWIEAAYWLYLTGEVWCSHSLVPSILTALTIETFSWYSLYKSQHFERKRSANFLCHPSVIDLLLVCAPHPTEQAPAAPETREIGTWASEGGAWPTRATGARSCTWWKNFVVVVVGHTG